MGPGAKSAPKKLTLDELDRALGVTSAAGGGEEDGRQATLAEIDRQLGVDPEAGARAAEEAEAESAAASTFRKISRFAGSMGRGFNDEFASILGLPGDVANTLLSMAGVSPQFAGRSAMKDLMDRTPVTETLQGNENPLAANIGRGMTYVTPTGAAAIQAGRRFVGGALGRAPLAPAMTPELNAALAEQALAKLANLGPAVREAGRDIAAVAAAGPRAFVAAETLAAAGAGAGQTVAEQLMPGSPTASMLGNLAGGVAPSAVGATGRAAWRATFGRRSDVEDRVADFMQRAAGNDKTKAADALRNYDDELGVDLTPAQITGAAGLLSLERSVVRSTNEMKTKFLDRQQAADAALTRAIEEVEPGTATREVVDEFFHGRVDRITDLVDERIHVAAAEARQRLDELTPDLRASQSQRLAREELDSAYTDARADESALWANIDQAFPIRTARTKNVVAGIRREFDRAVEDPADLPTDVLGAIDNLGDAEGLGRLLKLRSRVLADIRQARAGDVPNRKRVSNLERLQEAVLDDIGATQAAQERLLRQGQQTATGPASIQARNQAAETRKVRAALQFSRELNDKFTRGPVGKLLGYERAGGERTPAELTLEKVLQPGFLGLRNARALIEAGGGSERMNGLMEQYLRDVYVTSVAVPGQAGIDQAAHARFMKRHAELLDEFPDFKRQIGTTAEANALLASRQAQGERARRLLDKSRAKLWLEADDVPLALSRVLNAPTRVVRAGRSAKQISKREAAQNLMRSAAGDQTGMATSGVRRELLGVLLSNVRKGRINPATEQMALNTRALHQYLETQKPVLDAVLLPEQNARLRQILTEAQKVQRSLDSSIGGGSDTFENASVLTTTIARVLGAKIGANVARGSGYGAIQIPGMFARMGQRFVESLNREQAMALIEEAMLNPKVMRDLLERPTGSAEHQAALVRRLHAHLLAAGEQSSVEDTSQPQ